MGRANTSSVDTNDGYKIAVLGKQNKIATHAKFQVGSKENKNIVNSNKAKAAPTAQSKAKAKAKKALSKASRKQNKKK